MGESMSTDETTKAIVAEIVGEAKKDDNVIHAAKGLGKAVNTCVTFLNNALLPLAAINFGFEKARHYFQKQFSNEMEELIKNIPQDKLIEPKASIAGPTLQGLAFSHEEEELKVLYLNLLASSMNSDKAKSVHPSFVEIIKQLTPKEAELLKAIAPSKQLAIGEIHTEQKSGGYQIIYKHLIDLTTEETGEPYVDDNTTISIENLIRLGLLLAQYDKHLKTDALYENLENRPEFKAEVEKHEGNPEVVKITLQKGALLMTNLGENFSKSCGIIP